MWQISICMAIKYPKTSFDCQNIIFSQKIRVAESNSDVRILYGSSDRNSRLCVRAI